MNHTGVVSDGLVTSHNKQDAFEQQLSDSTYISTIICDLVDLIKSPGLSTIQQTCKINRVTVQKHG